MTTFDETSRVPGGGWPPADTTAPDPPAGTDPPGTGPAGEQAAVLAAADQDTILGRTALLTLTTGMQVRVKPLATRELLALLNIGVAGIGPRLGDLNLDPDEATETFVAKFAGLILSGLGAAADEAMAFLRMVIEPAGKVVTFRPDKAQRLRNAALDDELDRVMSNPHPDDTISIIEHVATMNAGDLQAWGKRLAGIFKLAQRTGRIPASPTSGA